LDRGVSSWCWLFLSFLIYAMLLISQSAYYWRLPFYFWNSMQCYDDGVIQFWSTEVCSHVLSLDLFQPPLGNLQTLLICECQILKLCCKKVMKLEVQPDLWLIVCSVHPYVMFNCWISDLRIDSISINHTVGKHKWWRCDCLFPEL
jgi:hypothetical protein